MDWKLELVPFPVTDVDRAKAFYVDQAGFVADHDHVVTDGLRFVQLTPPGSACSIAIGTGLTDSPPGLGAGLQLVVADVHAAATSCSAAGLEVGEVQTFDWGCSSSSPTPTATAGPCSRSPSGAEPPNRGLSPRRGQSPAHGRTSGLYLIRWGWSASAPSRLRRFSSYSS